MQAPGRRAPVSAETERRTKLVLYGVSALGFLGLAAAIGLFAFGGGGGGSAAQVMRDAGCQYTEKPALPADHVAQAPPQSAYNTWPPSSGPHNQQWAPYDVYTEPVQQFRLVHNLEHGAIVIQYGNGVPRAMIDELVEWYREDPNGLAVAPLPALGDDITLAVWNKEEDEESGTGRLARCPRFDRRAFDAFKNTYAFRGPERFPEELLTPGS